MQILVINSGSSSIKFSVFRAEDAGEPQSALEGEIAGVGAPGARLTVGDQETGVQADTLEDAVAALFNAVTGAGLGAVEAVGYRVVHPGAKIDSHCRITAGVLQDLQDASAFAPLHEPEALAVIREGVRRFPDLPHFACFDTVFHRTMPPEARTYALPKDVRDAGVQRYGFHGLSCESIVRQMAAQGPLPERLVIAHLGSGCSVTAVVGGQSIDTTMGLTPDGGVVMGTRPGDLDPGVVLYLLRQAGGSAEDAAGAVESMLNHKAGVAALSGLPNDLKAVRKAAQDGNPDATLALQVFTRSVRKAVGAFCWLMGGVDAVVFAGGIGEHDAATRTDVLGGLAAMGVQLDAQLNGSRTGGMRRLSPEGNAVALWVVPAQEDRMIASHVAAMMRAEQ